MTKSGTLRLVVMIGILGCGVSSHRGAAARQDGGPGIENIKRTFQEAEREMQAGRYAAARAKFAEVWRYRQTAGVRYHMAMCDEALGQLVAAWRGYREAHALARSRREKEAEVLAEKRESAVFARLATLSLSTQPSTAEVWVAGRPADRDERGAILLDPGEHELEVRAQGYLARAVRVTLAPGDKRVVEVHLFPNSPPTVGSRTAEPPTGRAGVGSGHWAGWLSASGALLLLGGGTVSYVLAGSIRDDAVLACGRAASCDDKRGTVRTLDGLALVGWGSGAALLGLSLYFFLRNDSAQTGLYLSPTGAGWAGRF